MKSITDRMKENYEDRYRIKLTRRTPVIVKNDGMAFHTLTKKCVKPFDSNFAERMQRAAEFLLTKAQGAKCAYVYSDEISILLIDYDRLESEAWFDYNLQKICSASAAIASTFFNFRVDDINNLGCFDARAFNVPKDEVNNYFVSRQQDCIRNSIQALAQSEFSHKSLQGLNQKQLLQKLRDEKDILWEVRLPKKNYGTFIEKSGRNILTSYPIFKNNRSIITKFI